MKEEQKEKGMKDVNRKTCKEETKIKKSERKK